jgi:Uma2 family endonuclease
MSTTLEANLVDEGLCPIVVHFLPLFKMSDDELFDFATINPDLWIERDKDGNIIIMPPAGSGSSGRNIKITTQLSIWAEQDGTGSAFDCSGGFIFPNTAMRAPDASWVSNARLEKLTDEEFEKFAPVCPEFVVELRSKSDRLKVLQEKMSEYIENGVQLGWLIDPQKRRVHVYRPGQEVQILDDPAKVFGELVLPGFELGMSKIW